MLEATNLRIERIVSFGHSSPEGFWYDQDQHEWVLPLKGAARLSIEGIVRELRPLVCNETGALAGVLATTYESSGGSSDLMSDEAPQHIIREILSSYSESAGERFSFEYAYDFGDGWVHEVLFEGCLAATEGQKYPICVEGERACPPEDVGGIFGYNEYLKIIGDPNHEQHEEMLEWSGKFDPEKFDSKKASKKASKKMQRGMAKGKDSD